jgi:adenine-specific DNA-methyltransferase
LKSIANNEEIDAIHEKFQPQLEALRTEINQVLGKAWEDWQIPREMPLTPTLSQEAREQASGLMAKWWKMRGERQKEIDASIAARADTELLYDQPYEENKKVRVTGPFTVESLSPHRVLSTDQERPASEQEGQIRAALKP